MLYSLFEELAVNVLEECQEQDEEDAKVLLYKEVFLFDDLTCLDIAISADAKNFISNPLCQALFDNFWMGDIPNHIDTWKVKQ